MPPEDAQSHADHTLLDMIEYSPTGAVPHTPTHQDALARLLGSHQVYASADHKGGYVTARSLRNRPSFHALNLEAFLAGEIQVEDLEGDGPIYDRYVASLPAALRAEAENYRSRVVARKIHHRVKTGEVIHDPAHTLVLVPGAGPHPGLPGNYLYGSVLEIGASGTPGSCGIHLHDREDGLAENMCDSRQATLIVLRDVLASAPFQLAELDAIGFHMV